MTNRGIMHDMPDCHRPHYHFTPPANWMNDPNGLIHWRGEFHLFYQHNPHAPWWDTMHWGHAASPDLVHWRHLPVAMAPLPGSPDADGCFSGCAVADGERVAFLYTGVVREPDGPGLIQLPCLAYGEGELLELRQYPGNPVVSAPPEGLDLEGFRDHSVWREPDGNWSMVIGAGLRKKYGLALRYTSPDLVQWTYAGELCAGPDLPATELYLGTMWECPGFIAVDGGHALMFSVWDPGQGYYSMIVTGEYADGRLRPRRLEKLDYGDTYFYAPQPFIDAQGRNLVMAWMQEGRSAEAQKAAGWSGVMSLPRQIHLDDQGRPLYEFISELHSLRHAHTGLANAEVRGVQPLGLHGDTLEMIVEFERGTAGSCGLLLRVSPDGEESTRLVVDWVNAELRLEREHASLDETTARTAHVAPLDDAQTCRLHVYLDHSALEVIANRRQAIATRIYPTRGDSLGTALFTEEGSARVARLDAWKLSL